MEQGAWSALRKNTPLCYKCIVITALCSRWTCFWKCHEMPKVSWHSKPFYLKCAHSCNFGLGRFPFWDSISVSRFLWNFNRPMIDHRLVTDVRRVSLNNKVKKQPSRLVTKEASFVSQRIYKTFTKQGTKQSFHSRYSIPLSPIQYL